jgi:hypothetical protein
MDLPILLDYVLDHAKTVQDAFVITCPKYWLHSITIQFTCQNALFFTYSAMESLIHLKDVPQMIARRNFKEVKDGGKSTPIPVKILEIPNGFTLEGNPISRCNYYH